MALTRRALLRSAAAGGAALAGGASLVGTAGCADFGAGEPADDMTLWYWAGSLSESVLDDEKKRLARQGLNLVRSAIGGDYRTKFLTTLAGRAAVPDIAGMNADVATYFPDADQFVDLRTLGAGKLADKYLTWKWKQGITPDGRMIAFPMDTGPTALYYRTDLLAQAGLPSEPGEVAASIKTWDDWLAAGRTLKAKIPHCTPVDSLAYLFRMVLSSATSRYTDENNHYIGDRGPTRYAWEIAAKAARDGLSAAAQFLATDWYALASAGRLPWFSGAVWVLNYLGPGAPKTKGKWRLTTAPGGPGNDGGSFLAISKYCQHPEQAFAAITWMQNAPNQVRAFHDVNLFPSAPAAFTDPALHKPNAFFGGQRTIEVFAKAATKVPICYRGPYDSIIDTIFGDELGKVESQGKNPDQAWKDVQTQVARELEHRGVSS